MRYVMVWAVLLLGGCSFKEAPVMKTYTMAIPSVSPVTHARYRNKILKVAYPVALNEKLIDDMYYSYSLSDRGSYLNSRWSNASGKLLQGTLIQVLSEAKVFRVVVPFNSDVDEDLRLESTVYDLSHHVRGKASYAVLNMHFTLIDAETGKLLKARHFSYRENTVTVDAKGYVQAVNRIMEKLSHDLIAWLN